MAGISKRPEGSFWGLLNIGPSTTRVREQLEALLISMSTDTPEAREGDACILEFAFQGWGVSGLKVRGSGYWV